MIEGGCEVDVAGARTMCFGERVDANSRLADTGEGRWPELPARDGGVCDLSKVPGPESRSHDVALLTELEQGWYAIRNPRRGIGVAMVFPHRTFRWLWMWQPYGGANLPPVDQGAYGLGLEPWTSPPNLAHATNVGQAVTLEPAESLEAELELTVFDAGETPVGSASLGGAVELRAEVEQ